MPEKQRTTKTASETCPSELFKSPCKSLNDVCKVSLHKKLISPLKAKIINNLS